MSSFWILELRSLHGLERELVSMKSLRLCRSLKITSSNTTDLHIFPFAESSKVVKMRSSILPSSKYSVDLKYNCTTYALLSHCLC